MTAHFERRRPPARRQTPTPPTGVYDPTMPIPRTGLDSLRRIRKTERSKRLINTDRGKSTETTAVYTSGAEKKSGKNSVGFTRELTAEERALINEYRSRASKQATPEPVQQKKQNGFAPVGGRLFNRDQYMHSLQVEEPPVVPAAEEQPHHTEAVPRAPVVPPVKEVPPAPIVPPVAEMGPPQAQAQAQATESMQNSRLFSAEQYTNTYRGVAEQLDIPPQNLVPEEIQSSPHMVENASLSINGSFPKKTKKPGILARWFGIGRKR